MSKRFLAVILALVMTLGLLPCQGAEVTLPPDGTTDVNGNYLPSRDARLTLCDTGRGYILYSFYASNIYYSPDGVTWTDLSGRQWVEEARNYIEIQISIMGHREFQFVWTGTEYMMRQDLRDNPRLTSRHMEDSPRNNLVTFLDEDFQIIGELPFDAAVEDIRYEDGTYYATVGGVETAFTREEWMAGKLKEVYTLAPDTEFTDVQDTDWFAPYVDVCVDAGLMVGVGGGLFAPEKTLSREECITLAARLHQMGQGGGGNLEMPVGGYTYAVLSDERTGELLSRNYLNRTFATVGPLEDRLDWGTFDPSGYSLGLHLETEEERAWGQARDGLEAVLSLNGLDYPGALHLSGDAIFFEPDPACDFESVQALRALPEDWFMATWLYVQQNKLGTLFQGEDARLDFAHRIAAVTDLPAINDIADNAVPDLAPRSDQDVLGLYRAGILNGVDDQGTFMGAKTLTRAEAAAMLARVLKPELQLRFTLPTVKEGTEE